MSGVRIQHPTARSTAFQLVDASRPYRRPMTCLPPPAGCGLTHLFKTYHLRLDESGAAIVSAEIVERLKRMPLQPFEITNEVAAPPDQIIRVPRLTRHLTALAPGDTHGQN